jgi:hypothetical protein
MDHLVLLCGMAHVLTITSYESFVFVLSSTLLPPILRRLSLIILVPG